MAIRCKPQYYNTLPKIVGIVSLILTYALPVGTSIFTSVTILRAMRRRDRQVACDAAAQERALQRKKATINLLAIFLAFVLLHTPKRIHSSIEVFVNSHGDVPNLAYNLFLSYICVPGLHKQFGERFHSHGAATGILFIFEKRTS